MFCKKNPDFCLLWNLGLKTLSCDQKTKIYLEPDKKSDKPFSLNNKMPFKMHGKICILLFSEISYNLKNI